MVQALVGGDIVVVLDGGCALGRLRDLHRFRTLLPEPAKLQPMQSLVLSVFSYPVILPVILPMVERLSRQAGEEGGERRRAEVKIKELESLLEAEIKEKDKLMGRVDRISAERDNLAQELKKIAQDVPPRTTVAHTTTESPTTMIAQTTMLTLTTTTVAPKNDSPNNHGSPINHGYSHNQGSPHNRGSPKF
ncbi:hypothetical protein J6590_059063 [Homalodisca vitripennis]|nr:hypothetical protein J6590_059063 [Homalodisca vitripennis]